MRARLAIAKAGMAVELREIELRHKPQALLAASAKGTVPVLQLGNSQVIDESLDIMFWALAQNDPDRWLNPAGLEAAKNLIAWNDGEFKYYLDRYKYPDRHPEQAQIFYRRQAELFLSELERRLTTGQYLCGQHFTLADAAILPFIRQFAAVDADWFAHSPYPKVGLWLKTYVESELFAAIMAKYKPWKCNDPPVLFSG